MLQTDRLSLYLAECFGFHLVISCKRRMQDAKCSLSVSQAWQLKTTAEHKSPILKGHTSPSFPLIPKCLITSLTSRTVFCLPLHIITLPSCEGRGRRESGTGGGQGHNYNNSDSTYCRPQKVLSTFNCIQLPALWSKYYYYLPFSEENSGPREVKTLAPGHTAGGQQSWNRETHLGSSVSTQPELRSGCLRTLGPSKDLFPWHRWTLWKSSGTETHLPVPRARAAHKHMFVHRFWKRHQWREKGWRSRGELELPGQVLERVGRDGTSTDERTPFHQEKGQHGCRWLFRNMLETEVIHTGWSRKKTGAGCEKSGLFGELMFWSLHGEAARQVSQHQRQDRPVARGYMGRAQCEMKSRVPCPKMVKNFKTTTAQRWNKHKHDVLRSLGPEETQRSHALVKGRGRKDSMDLCCHQPDCPQTRFQIHSTISNQNLSAWGRRESGGESVPSDHRQFSTSWFCSSVRPLLSSFYNRGCWFLFVSKSCLLSLSLWPDCSIGKADKLWA